MARMSKSKRTISAKTRVKLSQAAKRRHRAPKGSHYGGRFMESVQMSVRPKITHAGSEPYGPRIPGTHGGWKREIAHDARAQLHHGEISDDELVRHVARSRIMGDTLDRDGGPILMEGDIDRLGSIRTTSMDLKNVRKQARESNWQRPGMYAEEDALKPGAKRKYKTVASFLDQEMPPSHKKWFDEALSDPQSEFNRGLGLTLDDVKNKQTRGRFYSQAQRRRAESYVNALQEGKSHQEALDRLRTETRGRSTADATRRQVPITHTQKTPGRKSRYETVVPPHKGFTVGVDAARADKFGELRKAYPDASPEQIYRLQQMQRMNIKDELLKNQRWTHETRTSNILGGKNPEQANRVVFFTTSLGGPAPSVPADSLIGQYVIRQRKKMLMKEGIYGPKDLEGMYPNAVRDMHTIEASTGYAVGAEGRYGAFHRSGWRAGAKKSRNFGKPTPVGSQVIYDSAGRPMYDEDGNIRYSEGVTRPFSFETMKNLGFRVFVG